MRGGAAGTCSWNAVTAPGTETLTGAPGFPATNGTGAILSSHSSTSGTSARTNCTLYQDIAIPVGATTMTLSFALGTKNVVSLPNIGVGVGLYSTATVPGLLSPRLTGALTVYQDKEGATLTPVTLTRDVTSLAGTTVRLAFIGGANGTSSEVVGLDNVRADVTTGVPTLPDWRLLAALIALMVGSGVWTLRRRSA